MPLHHVVIDASVALKWVIEEKGTAAAMELLEGNVLQAPDFLLLEVANVLWSKARRGVLTRAEADASYEAIGAVPIVLTPLAELITPARSLAFGLDLTAYDAVYAALAQRLGCVLATADAALERAVNAARLSSSAMLVH